MGISVANCVAAVIAHFGGIACAVAQEPRQPSSATGQVVSPFIEETVEGAAVGRQKEKDLERISLGQASRFHRRVISTLNPVLPEDVIIRNDGPLASPSRHKPLKVNGLVVAGGLTTESEDVTAALSWSVEADLGIFGFWISTARTQSTVATCGIDGTDLFLNVDFVAGNRSVDEKLPELGGRSVRETLRLLEQACAQKSRPEGVDIEKSHNRAREPRHRDGPRNEKPQSTSRFSYFDALIELIQRENPQTEPDPQPIRDDALHPKR